MPKLRYRIINFRRKTEEVLANANAILAEYEAQGYELTLRQLYYQFVARDLCPNTQKEYKKLGDIITDGRYAGIIDWNAIEDRTRSTQGFASWDDPADIIAGSAAGYQVDLWAGQENHVEVWVEKDALVGVIERACSDDRIPFMACRGYPSASQMWRSAMKFRRRIEDGRPVHVIHLGDHDPSGIDMSRDIEDRIQEFIWAHDADGDMFHVHRIALNMNQVTAYSPPPNPVKVTADGKYADSRAKEYVARFGTSSWELDALDPGVIVGLIQAEAAKWIDADLMDEQRTREDEDKVVLQAVSDRWEEVSTFLAE